MRTSPKTILNTWVPPYLIFCALGGLFYILADFGKALTKRAGLVWCLLTVVALIAFCRRHRAIFKGAVLIILVMQIPIICNWVIWSGASFYFLSWRIEINPFGSVPHILLLLLSGYIVTERIDTGSRTDAN